MFKLISEKNYENLMSAVVEPGLAAMREEIRMPLAGGGELHAEVYNRYDAKRAVVFSTSWIEATVSEVTMMVTSDTSSYPFGSVKSTGSS